MKKSEGSLDSKDLTKGRISVCARKKPKTKGKDFRIDVYKAWCKACGICEAFCPVHVFVKDEEGYPRVVHQEGCTGCGWCEIHCPDFAITVHEKKPRKS